MHLAFEPKSYFIGAFQNTPALFIAFGHCGLGTNTCRGIRQRIHKLSPRKTKYSLLMSSLGCLQHPGEHNLGSSRDLVELAVRRQSQHCIQRIMVCSRDTPSDHLGFVLLNAEPCSVTKCDLVK